MYKFDKGGVCVTPEMLEEIRGLSSAAELVDFSKKAGVDLDKGAAEKLLAKAKSTANGDCCSRACPKCGSTDISQHYVPTSPYDGTLYLHCNHCGYDAVIPG